MKRDMDLIRALLLKLEALPMRLGGIVMISPEEDAITVDGYTPEQIDYHLSQIRKAGFIDEGGVHPMVGTGFRGLTWAGHDFLDSVRDPEIWRATKEGAKKAGGFSLELLVDLAKGLIKKKIEEHTGIQI
jgi:hypothetical protein